MNVRKLHANIGARWCASVDHCDKKHGPVSIGALTGKERLRAYNLTVDAPHQKWSPKSVRCWRLLVPPSIAEIAATAVGAKLWLDHGQTIYNFGVFEGASMYTYRAFFPKAELLAFDSFEGLPEEKAGEVARSTWVKGTFRVVDTTVTDRITQDLGPARTRVFKGYYNKVLTPELARGMRPATMIDIDSDIYVSAYQALDWVFTHKLAVPGTLVVYDDWPDYVCAPFLTREEVDAAPYHEQVQTMSTGSYGKGVIGQAMRRAAAKGHFLPWTDAGEPKAHVEITQKHKVEFVCVAGSCRAPASYKSCDQHRVYGALFVIKSIGHIANHGVTMTNDDLKAFRKDSSACNFVQTTRYTLLGSNASSDLQEDAVNLRHHRPIRKKNKKKEHLASQKW